jgi:RNA polymerase sigma factor (sigma-70 family)
MPLPFAGPDRLLAHFQRTGDPRSLGRLFDRTAPELLRVACWLASNRADAEDLLQRTFLTVLTARDSYDPARRALPWLCGVLGNHAKKLREERARPPLCALPAAVRDPVAAAADAEIAAAVASLRDRIGAPYAQVLDLHLHEGLDAKTIAARLGRPAGTVRTQLVRALRRLRDLLPGGFVAGAGALLTANAQAASLATVRGAVLRAAGAHAIPAAAAATVLGGLVMAKKALLVLPLVALLGAGMSWLVLRGGGEAAARPGQRAMTVAAARPSTADTPTAAGSAQAAAIERVGVELPHTPAADPDSGTVVVRATWAHDGSPAAAIGICVKPHERNVVHERHALTAADGVATLRGITPGPCWVASPFATMAVPEVRAGDVHAVELRCERDFELEGTVVDAHQRPVADARVWVSDSSPFRGHEVARSDDRGAFRIPVRSHVYVGARKAGYAASRLRCLTDKNPIVLVVAGDGGSVRGRVVDPAGRPIADALVELGWPGGFNVQGSTVEHMQVHPTAPALRTGADGSFAHDGIAIGSTDVRAWAAGHAPATTQVLVEANRTAEVVVVLPPGAVVTGVVRDGAGAPVADATVGLSSAIDFREFGASRTRTDAGGRFRLEDLPTGRVPLVARKGDDRASASLELAAGTPAEWNPVLRALAPFAGRVVDPDGRPLRGLNVGIVDGSQPLPSRIAPTDDDGCFELTGVDRNRLHLMVLVEHEPIAERRDVPRTADRTTITLTPTELPTASIRGRVVDEHGAPIAGATFTLMLSSSSFGTGTISGTDGTFSRERLRAGRFRASIRASGYGQRQLPALALQPHESRDLGDVVLARAGKVEITLAGHTEQRGAQVKLVREDGSDVEWLWAEGALARSEMPPGRYVAMAQLGDDTAGSTPLVVRGGETTRVTLACAPAAQVAIECRLGAPRPEGFVRVQVFDSGDALIAAWSLHADRPGPDRPSVLRERLAPGRYRVAIASDDGRSAAVPLLVPDVASTPSVVLELPAR